MSPPDAPQRIGRLTPLNEVLAALARLARPVAARALPLDLACGRVLAADMASQMASAGRAVALRDGWAVRADLVADAGPYMPVPVSTTWVEAGDAMPDDTDAVLRPDAVQQSGEAREAVASAQPGDGVLRSLPGGEEPLAQAGTMLRALDIAALRGAGIREITVREPMLTVVSVNRQTAAGDDTVSPLIAAAAEALGARAHIVRASVAAGALENALRDGSADAVVTIGGTGEGRGDRAVAVTGGYGAVALHGMAIRRGETAALASVGARPVLMLPGRLDAALAVWLLVGRPMIARLTGFSGTGRTFTAPLTRKLVSSIGLADVAFVLLSAGGAEPLLFDGAPPHMLAAADGFVVIPPESEGYPAGTVVEIGVLP